MPALKYNKIKNSKVVKIPAYMREIYGKLYANKKLCQLLDDERIAAMLSIGSHKKIVSDVVKEISTNSSVLQLGCTFGRQIEATSEKVGSYGKYVVVDVDPTQIERCRSKSIYQKIDFQLYDAATPFNEKYDVVIVYMLLHELPPTTRAKVVNNALDCVEEGGKVIFVDYHQPSKWNVLRFLIKPFNRLYQPFAESMWTKSIENYALYKRHFLWRKKTYAGKMYQKLVAVRQVPSFEQTESKQSFY